MNSFEQNLEKYAELAVKVGLNVQEGQTVVIMTPVSCAPFARKVSLKAYQAGAKNVILDWEDDEAKAIRLRHAPEEALNEYPMKWKADGFEALAAEGAGFFQILAPNTELLKGIDPERVSKSNKASAVARNGFLDYLRNNKINWTIVAVPTPEWSAQIFPGLDEETRMAKLWEQIFKLTRVDKEDPVEAWKQHIHTLVQKQNYLNERRYAKLHYRGPGTDLTVELPKKHMWVSAGSTSDNGIFYVPNLPTEEVFTLPHKKGVNGTVSSTMPLSYNGSLIDGFSFTFENGKIIKATAKQGEEILQKLLDMDEGARYLGEIALVPNDSPISNSNLIYYNTLFDENASCHLAIGSAYPFTLEGGTSMNKEELEAEGSNVSITHVDFMIGSAELDIDGITEDGTREPLFRKGNWA
jgi:aminopeptidase